ncbi:MAG: hypothetical protein IT383_00715 [Deltaproteobacteria bacterium]|nr:hypothetical protein [Deltaproteobacteria bacterium]
MPRHSPSALLVVVAVAVLSFPARAAEPECKPIDLTKGRTIDASRSVGHGVTAISIRRTRCYGTCPDYTFTVQADGSVEYEGRAHAAPAGKHTGKTDTWRFHNLARLVDEVGFFCFADKYTAPITDNPTAFVTVTMGGRTKTVENYANAGPQVLWAIEQLIDDMKRDTTWNGAPAQPNAPTKPKLPLPKKPTPLPSPVDKGSATPN